MPPKVESSSKAQKADTRQCPLEINLTESTGDDDPWACTVSLYKKYVYDGSHGRPTSSRATGRNTIAATKPVNEGATRKRPLGPWILQDGEHFVFAKTSNKDDVAILLEWAQIATLNPQSSHEDYIPGSPSFKRDRTCQVGVFGARFSL